MPLRVDHADVARMRADMLFDGEHAARKLSRFWVLLLLAALIASAGVVADSTATVIGAMIVAPLMVPILGTVVSVTTADGANLARSLALVVAGAAAVVAIGYLFGLLIPVAIVESTNSQVASRVHPNLVDLIAALATGAVGAFALVRSDVSDALPGVAIAISLVPPLAVVGLTLESGAGDQSFGALLLFLTNVGAILLTGLIVLALYRVYQVATPSTDVRGMNRRLGIVIVVLFVIALCVPLGVSTARVTSDAVDRSQVTPVANRWATQDGWRVTSVRSTDDGIEVQASGGLPAPDPARLRDALRAAGLGGVHVVVALIPSERVDLSTSGS